MSPEPTPRWTLRSLIAMTALVTGLVACGDDDTGGPEPSLSSVAAIGRELAQSKGCASCHGGSGQGGVGPSWIGLAGSEVQLSDGSTVIADEAYLTRAITDPNAEMVDGYTLQMPTNSLTADEVAQIVDYITALGGPGETGGSTVATTADS
ncbi:MAG: c-type cytochrome [Desertimonas sp.]